MGLFSKTGFLSKAWTGIKKEVTIISSDIADVFKDVETDVMPELVLITQDVNVALNSGVVEDVVAAINPEMGGVPEKLLTLAQTVTPKVLADELGIEALGTSPSVADATAWAQSAIAAFASKTFTQQTKIYSTLLGTLASEYQGEKASGATWIQWLDFGQKVYGQVMAAIAAAKAAETAAN